MIAGCSGAGKSTFARKLGQLTELPVVHLDQQYWLPGWVEPTSVVWRARMQELVRGEQWIMDGNYSATWDLRLPRTQLVIYLDYSLWRKLFWAMRRVWRYHGTVRPDMAEGCPENYNWDFVHHLLMCHWKGRKRHLKILKTQLPKYAELVVLRSPRELEEWWRQVGE